MRLIIEAIHRRPGHSILPDIPGQSQSNQLSPIVVYKPFGECVKRRNFIVE